MKADEDDPCTPNLAPHRRPGHRAAPNIGVGGGGGVGGGVGGGAKRENAVEVKKSRKPIYSHLFKSLSLTEEVNRVVSLSRYELL